ncbi:hypothetical protein ACKWTF_005362 [Chironomus riparius]
MHADDLIFNKDISFETLVFIQSSSEEDQSYKMDVFKSQMFVYKLIGIKRFQSDRMKKCFYILKIWNCFAILFCISTAIIYASSTNDIREIAQSMGPAFTCLVMIIKFVTFSVRTEKIFKIMDDIEELNEEYKNLKDANEIISKANELTVKITNPLKWGCILASLFYIVKPLGTDFIYYYFYELQPIRGVPLKAKFFYDETQSPAYQITFCIQSYTTILIGTIVVCIKITSN